MKILFYIPIAILDDARAGSIHMRELAENLSRLGNKISIACQLRNKIYTGTANIKRVKLVDLKVVGFILSTLYGLFLGMVTVSRRKYDLVYARAALNGFNAYLVASLARLPCVIEVNGLIRDEIKIGWVGWWRKAAGYIISWFEGISFRRCHHLIAITPELKKALMADYSLDPEKITVIPNGANIDLFRPMDSTEVRKRLNLNQADYLVVFTGQFVAWEGVHYMIKCVPYVLQECPDTKFLIVGDGVMKQELVRLSEQIGVSDKTIFTGRIPYDKVPLYVNASDVCVAPLIKERNEKIGGASPLKIYEYAACEKAIVTSRLPGLEFIEQYKLGILVEPDNPVELASAIIKLLQDPERRKQMGNNGRKHVVENHSWESVARKVAEVCEQVIEQHEKIPKNRKP